MRRPVHPPLLGHLEATVMELLWTHGEAEAKDVHQRLGKARGITLNTVQSTLKRLFEKGLLDRHKVSHAHVYRPRLSRQEFHSGALGELISELMGGQADAMVSAFVSLTERAGPQHLERLEKLVAERRRALKAKK